MDVLIPVKDTDHVVVGDILEYHFTAFGGTIIKAAQIAIIESRLRKQSKLQLLSTQASGKTIKIRVRITKEMEKTIEVQEASVISVGATIAVILLILGGLVWVTQEGVYKIAKEVKEIAESPWGKILLAGGGTMALAAGLAAILALFGRKK